MKARYYSPDQKSAWLEEWRESGLSAQVFSKDKPFSPSSLLYWNRKDNSPKSGGFIEVSSFSSPSMSGIRITYPNGCTLEVNYPLSVGQIKSLIA